MATPNRCLIVAGPSEAADWERSLRAGGYDGDIVVCADADTAAAHAAAGPWDWILADPAIASDTELARLRERSGAAPSGGAADADASARLFALSPQPTWVHDAQTQRFLAVNDAALALYGYSRPAFLTLRLSDLAAPGAASEPGRPLQQQTADGTPLQVELAMRAIEWGQRPAQLVVARDVTVQRRAIEAMEANERRFRELFEHSVGLICTHDIDGVLLSVNPAAAAALGYSVSELVGRPLIELVPVETRQFFLDYLKRIARTGIDTGRLYVQRRDGATRVWRYSNRLYRDTECDAYVMGHASDITELKLYEHQLKQQQAELEAVNDASPVGMFRTDLSGACTYVNQTWERLSGLRADQAPGTGWLDAVHPEDRERVAAEWTGAVREQRKYLGTYRFRHADGRTLWVSIQAAPIVVDGEVTGYAGAAEDITKRRNAEQMLKRSERRLRTIADALPAMIGYVDSQQRFVFANAAYARTYGLDRTKVVGRHVRDVLGPTTYARRRPYIERALHGEEVRFEDEVVSDLDYRCMQVTYIPQRDDDDDEVLGFHVMVTDTTQTKLQERRLIEAAEVDSLTGLANRAGFLARLERALARSRDQGTLVGLMYLDIDHFKQVNDTYGHAVGDALLRAFAERLSTALRSSDVIGRLGGDEFTVITEGVRRPEYASAAAAKIVTAMRRPFVLGEQTLSVSTSVGLAIVRGTERISVSELLERADRALYQAKEAGRNAYRVAGG